MSEAPPPPAIMFDQPLGFSIDAADVRGRLVRLGPTLRAILAAHDYPPAAQCVLAEALVLTALLGATLKDGGRQLTMQAQTKGGPISLLVCDYLDGALRGYLAFDADAIGAVAPGAPLEELFGEGFLALTFDLGDVAERYQGIVPLEGSDLADAAARYFRQSEQLPTVIRLAFDADGAGGAVAGGVMMQRLAAGELGGERLDVRAEAAAHEEVHWEHLATLAASAQPAELCDSALPLDALVWRLFHEEDEVRITPGAPLTRGCRCDPAYLASVIARFPADEQADMVDADGLVQIDCAFCSKVFAVDPRSAAAGA